MAELTIITHALFPGRNHPAMNGIYKIIEDAQAVLVLENEAQVFENQSRASSDFFDSYFKHLVNITNRGTLIEFQHSASGEITDIDLGDFSSFRVAGGFTDRCLSYTLVDILKQRSPIGETEIKIDSTTAYFPIQVDPNDIKIFPDEYVVSLDSRLKNKSDSKAIAKYFAEFTRLADYRKEKVAIEYDDHIKWRSDGSKGELFRVIIDNYTKDTTPNTR